jgi:hypothetical protein
MGSCRAASSFLLSGRSFFFSSFGADAALSLARASFLVFWTTTSAKLVQPHAAQCTDQDRDKASRTAASESAGFGACDAAGAAAADEPEPEGAAEGAGAAAGDEAAADDGALGLGSLASFGCFLLSAAAAPPLAPALKSALNTCTTSNQPTDTQSDRARGEGVNKLCSAVQSRGGYESSHIPQRRAPERTR